MKDPIDLVILMAFMLAKLKILEGHGHDERGYSHLHGPSPAYDFANYIERWAYSQEQNRK